MPNTVQECDRRTMVCFQAWHDIQSSRKQDSILKTTINAATSDFAGLKKICSKNQLLAYLFHCYHIQKQTFHPHQACINRIHHVSAVSVFISFVSISFLSLEYLKTGV